MSHRLLDSLLLTKILDCDNQAFSNMRFAIFYNVSLFYESTK